MNKVIQAIVCALLIFSQPAHAQTLDALLKAVAEDNMSEALFYLDRGMEADTTDQRGNTLLMIASRLGYVDMVQMLLGRKASVARQTPAGDTALLMASLGGHLEVVKLLVEAGAPVQTRTGWQPIHYAAFGGSAPVIEYLLDHGADKNALAPSNRFTPVMLAVRNGNGDAAKLLIARGADLSNRSAGGETALTIAERKEDSALISLLKRSGAVQ